MGYLVVVICFQIVFFDRLRTVYFLLNQSFSETYVQKQN